MYARHPVRTHLVTADDDAAAVITRYVGSLADDVRVVSVSERMVAITQGRAYPIKDIRAGRLARFLERFVTRPGYGIGLGSAETMELAIREVGAPRILLAAAASAVTKPFGVHGVFYRVAGPQAKAIDGPTSYTIPPYNQAATPRPAGSGRRGANPGRRHRRAGGDHRCERRGVRGARCEPRRRSAIRERLFTDNPLGQAREQTPICVGARGGLAGRRGAAARAEAPSHAAVGTP